MAENLGSIRYDVEVDTANVLKAEAVVNKSIANVAKDFDKADKAVREFTKAQLDLGNRVNKAGQVIDKNGDIVVSATKQYRDLSKTAKSSFKELETAATRSASGVKTQMTKSAEGVKKSVHRNYGQAGIQIQQFAGQLQGGQSAMLALSQQSADLGIVLGAPLVGVVVSLAAVLAGTLAPAIFDSVSSIEKLQKAIENTKTIMSVGASGVAEYTEEMKKLNIVSENLAKIKIAVALNENRKAIKDTKNDLLDLTDGLSRKSTFSSVIDEVFMMRDALKDFGKATNDVDRIIALDKADELIAGLRQADGSFQYQDIAEFAKKYLELSSNVRTVIESNQALTDSQGDVDSANSVSEESFKDMKNSIRANIIELKSGKRAALEWSLLMQDLDADQRAEILTLFDKKQALEDTKKATEDAAAANERYEKSVVKQTESDLAWFEQQEQWLKGKDKSETQSNITFAQGVINKGKSPEQLMGEQYERLKQLRDTDLENAQLYQDAMTALEIQAQENRENLLAESYQRVGEQAATSMGEYLAGVKTAEEATRDLAATIITQAINSLVQMGTTALIQSATTTTAATTGIAATTGAAVTSTGVMAGAQTTAMSTVAGAVGVVAGGLATAWAPAAAFASLATLGTNAAPAIAGIYSTMAATLGAQLVGGLISSGIEAGTGFAGANMSGGREFGGPVSAGSMYRVGEKGKPEFYKDNLGNLSMIPGENGEVIPANKMGGSSGGMTVQVNNYTPYQVFVTQDQATNIAKVEIGNEASKLQKGRGNMYNAMKSGGNYKNDAKR